MFARTPLQPPRSARNDGLKGNGINDVVSDIRFAVSLMTRIFLRHPVHHLPIVFHHAGGAEFGRFMVAWSAVF